MTDRIEIKDLLLCTIIGINDEEREKQQDVVINVILETDTRPAARSDDIVQAVNYRTIAKQIIDLVENSRYFLVETMAEEIATICLSHESVERARVSVDKPGALRFARSVGVTIERSGSGD